MKLISIFSLLLFVGCQCGHTSSAKEESATLPTKQLNLPKTSTINKGKLLGIWTDGSTENATFDILKDSIFYVDQLTAYKYHIKGDSIIIGYPDWVYKGKVSFSKDTLIFSGEDGTTKYKRFTQ